MPSACLNEILSYVDDSIRMPYNIDSGKPYTGVNALSLMNSTIYEHRDVINHPVFGTIKQWNKNGFVKRPGNVRCYYVTMGCNDTFITYPIYRSIDMIESETMKKKIKRKFQEV